MVRDMKQQTSDVNGNLKESTRKLGELFRVHDLIDAETKKGKGILQTMSSRAFWDRHLYELVFVLHLIVSIYIISKHVSNLAFRIYDWSCWLSGFSLFWIPGFDCVCSGYSWSWWATSGAVKTVGMKSELETAFKPEL